MVRDWFVRDDAGAAHNVHALGGYSVLYADPPWSYQDQGCNGAQAEHYNSMSFEELCALPVERLAARDSVLFLWATYPKLEEALALIPKWGFRHKSIGFQWVKTYPSGKPVFGLGRWTRGNTEPCFLATRGKPHRIDNAVSQLILSEDVLAEVRGRHSEKPAEARARIEKLMGPCSRVELFARTAAEGWDRWGNEVSGSVELLDVPARAA